MSINMEGRFEAALSRIDAAIWKLRQPNSPPLDAPCPPSPLPFRSTTTEPFALSSSVRTRIHPTPRRAADLLLPPPAHSQIPIEKVTNPHFISTSLKGAPIKMKFPNFKEVKLPNFKGGDPTNWILGVEHFFEFYRISDAEKLKYAWLGLSGSATLWYYKHIKPRIHEISWSLFLEKLIDQFDSTKLKDSNKSMVVDEENVIDDVSCEKNRDGVVFDSLENLEMENYRSDKSSKVFDELENQGKEKLIDQFGILEIEIDDAYLGRKIQEDVVVEDCDVVEGENQKDDETNLVDDYEEKFRTFSIVIEENEEKLMFAKKISKMSSSSVCGNVSNTIFPNIELRLSFRRNVKRAEFEVHTVVIGSDMVMLNGWPPPLCKIDDEDEDDLFIFPAEVMAAAQMVKYFNFPFPITLTMTHMGFPGLVAFFLVRVCKVVPPVKMTFQIYATCVNPISAFFASSLWFGNTAYLYISVVFIQMLKALNFSIFLVIGRTGAVTIRVAGVLKDWILIALSTVIFPESAITGLNVIGYAVALCGVVVYNYLKVKDVGASNPVPESLPDRATKDWKMDKKSSDIFVHDNSSNKNISAANNSHNECAHSKVSLHPQPAKQDSDEELEYADFNSGVFESPSITSMVKNGNAELTPYALELGKSESKKVEESGPGATTGMILSLRESLQSCKDNLAACQAELEAAQSEIRKWYSAFQSGSASPAGTNPEPALVITYLQNLKSSEESLKERLEKAKKREAAFIVTFAKREQEIVDLKSADLKKQLRPPSSQTRRLLLDPAIQEELPPLLDIINELVKSGKELDAVFFLPARLA